MTFLEAREKIVQALHHATDALNDPRFADSLRDRNQDVKFAEMNMDSLAAIECSMMLEEETGMEIDPAQIAMCESVNGLARFICGNMKTA
jgi:acyl carrier protein